jgi:undecaprenyl phosphate-alpha-L-ara4FN deformylase
VRVLDQLFTGWKAQGYELVGLGALCASVEPLALPRCETALARLPGRPQPLLLQGEEFLAGVELRRAA